MEYKHFSHEHNLRLHQVQPGQQLRCSGCESYCYESVYACWQCNFFLHEHCGNANRYVKHPCHALHPLILIPRPTYTGGSFFCDACGAPGTSFSYCCALCEVDLHVPCAFLPPTATHASHPHELSLSHNLPTQKISPDACKLCNQLLDPKHWTYDCLICDFRVHTFCATREVKPGLYQDDDEPTTTQLPQSGPKENDFEVSGERPEGEATEDPIVQLYKLQVEMEMANQLAQMMASFNLSSLV
ncbi:Nucleoredoxin 1-1 like [Actinidia chinensis var. chinensis]|uniref:Nucleoredoxin 1-1 like n=1 Tax=Actinidia chinensis var. chinensis TaxID=1590841 RepID=A0A2R6R570_ACTCC|nr:Nucleoredoxin 1-1 like [Actinidia chinensis var. chinensis]